MPELPEAETIARGLNDSLPGRQVRHVSVLRPDILEGPAHSFQRSMEGRVFEQASRRGKNVVLPLASGERVVVNLGMTGKLLPSDLEGPAPTATHPALVFQFEGGGGLTYDDVRRFGRVSFKDSGAWDAWSGTLGPEPLGRSFSAEFLQTGLATSRTPVRTWLLDQKRVAGVGNIYAVEALWAARVHPARPANNVVPGEARALHRWLRKILREAIAARGTTLRNYRAADGSEGGFGPTLRAYGREHRPCLRCKTPIVRTVIQGRSAFFCPRCQPES